MRIKPAAAAAFALMLLMFAAAVGVGAHRHWSGRREAVGETLTSLTDMLSARVEVAHNILTVASRHASLDDLTAEEIRTRMADIRAHIAVLSGRTGSLREKADANAEFSRDAGALLATLAAQPSVRADDRDLMYVEQMLPQALEQSAYWTGEAAYNTEAAAFNSEMDGTFSGRLAQLLGVNCAEQFIPSDGEAGQP